MAEIDPNQVAWLPPEAVARRDGRDANDGEYLVLDGYETVGEWSDPVTGDKYPGTIKEIWNDKKAVYVTTQEQRQHQEDIFDADGEVVLNDDGDALTRTVIDSPARGHYEFYDGEPESYVPRKVVTSNDSR